MCPPEMSPAGRTDARPKSSKTPATPAAGQTFRNGCANHVGRWSKLREMIFSEPISSKCLFKKARWTDGFGKFLRNRAGILSPMRCAAGKKIGNVFPKKITGPKSPQATRRRTNRKGVREPQLRASPRFPTHRMILSKPWSERSRGPGRITSPP